MLLARVWLSQLVMTAFGLLKPARRRTYQEFAEQELVLATGPRKGLRFRTEFMPWTLEVLREFDRGFYRRFFASGPVQSGKTLIFFILPILYHLFECGESVIVGVPKVDMAQGIWEERILPAILASRYAELIPRRGAGSKGGKFVAIRFANGAVLRFMGAGGGDAQRSSHTARVIVMTELDKMDEAGENSREADPVTQIEARSRSYGDLARIFGECTMSTSYGRIFKEVTEFGTDSKIWVPCQKCGEYVTCDRKDFSGWQDAKDLVEARARGHFSCPACAAPWSEADRAAALRKPVIAGRDQVVTRSGAVTGTPPATNTWGFRWNAMHNALVTMGDIAESEFRAERSGRPEEAKSLMQFTWAEPFEEQLTDLSGLTKDLVLTKISSTPRGVIPDGIVKLTLTIDPGLYRCWWILIGWRADASGHVVDYGALEVHQERQANPLNILSALRAFRDDAIAAGWGGRQPDLVLVDSGYQKDLVYQFVLESGQPRYTASKGLGTSRNQDSWRSPRESSDTKLVGNEWLIVLQPGGIRLAELHADHWKATVHEGFAIAAGGPGSITLFQAQVRDHLSFARQITAERREEEFVPGRGSRVFWNRLWKDNHYLDVTSYARAAADMLGIRLIPRVTGAAAPRRQQAPSVSGGDRRLRSRY